MEIIMNTLFKNLASFASLLAFGTFFVVLAVALSGCNATVNCSTTGACVGAQTTINGDVNFDIDINGQQTDRGGNEPIVTEATKLEELVENFPEITRFADRVVNHDLFLVESFRSPVGKFSGTSPVSIRRQNPELDAGSYFGLSGANGTIGMVISGEGTLTFDFDEGTAGSPAVQYEAVFNELRVDGWEPREINGSLEANNLSVNKWGIISSDNNPSIMSDGQPQTRVKIGGFVTNQGDSAVIGFHELDNRSGISLRGAHRITDIAEVEGSNDRN